MTPEEIKDICRRAFEEGIGKRDLAVIDELFSPNEAEAAKKASKHWHTVTPDLQYTVEDVIAEGDKGVVRWTCVSTHTGVLWGIAPTGKRLTTAGILIFRIEGGKIVELDGCWNDLDALIQLGAIPQKIAEAHEAFQASLEAS